VSEWVAMSNYRANRLVCDAADRAMQVHGGMGYSRHKPFEHIYRHHRRYRITEGSEEIQIRRVAGALFGFWGAQKTATFREYERQRNHGRVRWMEAPENGGVGEFVTRLAADMSPQSSGDKKRAHLLRAVKAERCFIIDNCQDLYKPDWQDRQPAFSYMRRLQDETGCTIIMSITPTFEKVLAGAQMAAFFEQFEGRSGGQKNWLRLPDYAPQEDVLKIAEAFGMADARKHAKTLLGIAREPGRIRRLFEDLQDARTLAGEEPLTIEQLSEIRGEE
ncbi:MAG: AAA family ATPase, partial [Verrucomicrobia bacterium]|nr:AAA family ATPase [Verrucomicrobiota bacterium]